MTHAFLYFEGKPHKPHGREFQQKISEINRILVISIKTSHSYLMWYRCDGKCKDKESSLFGYVSRICTKLSDDPVTSKSHRLMCGGTFKKTVSPTKELLKVITKHYRQAKPRKTRRQKTDDRKFVFLRLKTTRSSTAINYATSDDES